MIAEDISGNNGYVELSFRARKLDDKVWGAPLEPSSPSCQGVSTRRQVAAEWNALGARAAVLLSGSCCVTALSSSSQLPVTALRGSGWGAGGVPGQTVEELVGARLWAGSAGEPGCWGAREAQVGGGGGVEMLSRRAGPSHPESDRAWPPTRLAKLILCSSGRTSSASQTPSWSYTGSMMIRVSNWCTGQRCGVPAQHPGVA